MNVRRGRWISRLYAYGLIVANDWEKVVIDRVLLLYVYSAVLCIR